MPFFKGKLGVAVIEMQGIIGTTIKEPEYSRLLESVQNNRKIGALVPDIDSPGGSATATSCTKMAAASPSASPSSPPCAAWKNQFGKAPARLRALPSPA